MNLTARALFLLISAAMMTAPIAGLLGGHVGTGLLGGVEARSEFPSFTFADYIAGHFQDRFETWFAKHFAFRAALIRTDNQLNYSIFRTTKPGTVLGKNGFLYEPGYIEAYAGRHPTTQGDLTQFVVRLQTLHRALAARGILLAVMITPSKASLYPEHLPSRYGATDSPDDTYQRFQEELRRQGIPLFDSIPLIRELKAQSPYPVFPPGGTHWSKYAACRAAVAFTASLESMLRKPLPQLSCDPPVVRNRAVGIDRDLAKLTNLWSDGDFDVPLPYPQIRVTRTPESYSPSLLFVGDSFLWPFFEALEKKSFYERRDFLYYYKSLDRFRARRRAQPRLPVDRADLNWEELLGKDAVVLEFNEINIREMGYGFVEDAIEYLRAADRMGR